MGRLCLPLSPPEVSGYRGVGRRIRADGTNGFSDEFMHSGGNTRSLIRLCRRVIRLQCIYILASSMLLYYHSLMFYNHFIATLYHFLGLTY